MIVDNKCFSCPDFNLLSGCCRFTSCIKTTSDIVFISEITENTRSYNYEQDPDYGVGKWS